MTKTRTPRSICLRPAQRLQTNFETPVNVEPLPELPTALWQELKRLSRQHKQAIAHGWLLAAARLQREFRHRWRRFQAALAAVGEELDRPRPRKISPSFRDLLADLQGLAEDFTAVRFEQAMHLLSVTTEPITLEEIELGPFEIQLNCQELQTGQASPYRVVALEPNSASSNEGVTHPHVQCGCLCEGDGRQAITAALAQGRLHDFFVIVANLLRTYNDGSPYVCLHEWSGVTCDECGDLCSSDAILFCGQCTDAVCTDCSDCCASCEERACSGCLEGCCACHEAFCRGCQSTCVDCESPCCSACLSANERCPACYEHQEEEENLEPLPADSSPTQQTGATLQPDRLGQTAVPA